MDELDNNAPWQYHDDFRIIIGNTHYDQCIEMFNDPTTWYFKSWHTFIGSLDFSDTEITKQLPKDYKKYIIEYIDYYRFTLNKKFSLAYLIKYIYLLSLDNCPSYIIRDFIRIFSGEEFYEHAGYANLQSMQENVYLPHFYTMNANDRTKLCNMIYEKNYTDDFIYTMGITDKQYYSYLSPDYQIGILI